MGGGQGWKRTRRAGDREGRGEEGRGEGSPKVYKVVHAILQMSMSAPFLYNSAIPMLTVLILKMDIYVLAKAVTPEMEPTALVS